MMCWSTGIAKQHTWFMFMPCWTFDQVLFQKCRYISSHVTSCALHVFIHTPPKMRIERLFKKKKTMFKTYCLVYAIHYVINMIIVQYFFNSLFNDVKTQTHVIFLVSTRSHPPALGQVHVFYLPPGHSRDVPWWEIMMWCPAAYGQSTYHPPPK